MIFDMEKPKGRESYNLLIGLVAPRPIALVTSMNPDGGLKSFGRPVGAAGLRMFFEAWLQLRGEAPEERRITTADRGLALTHNLGGYPGEMVSFVGIVGNERG